MAVFDSYDNYYDRAMKAYCSTEKIDSKNINDEQNEIIIKRSCVHIGFYITWVINNNLVGCMHKEYDLKDLEKVKEKEMTGVDFFLKCCDGKLWSEDFNDEGLAFTEHYYASGQFMKDYIDFILNELNDIPCEFDFHWNYYEKFEVILNRRYESFCKN
ncbi:hypothetical protein [Clostridium thailandense]|uniref:DUF7832 domain-containing protein n=1 Tax=Clostridium thailandense TaxID=2794346 RepID=UPI0039893A86